jgi:hypothetical protein
MLPAMYFKGCFIYDNAYEGILLQLIFENIFEKFRSFKFNTVFTFFTTFRSSQLHYSAFYTLFKNFSTLSAYLFAILLLVIFLFYFWHNFLPFSVLFRSCFLPFFIIINKTAYFDIGKRILTDSAVSL